MSNVTDPPSDRTLRPSLHVMDYELRDWACSFYMKMLTDSDYPKYISVKESLDSSWTSAAKQDANPGSWFMMK